MPTVHGTDAVADRRLVLGNNDVRIGYVVTGTDPSPYYRNAIGDECVYVETGSGTVETVFGLLAYRAGDYVVIPRATTHRWLPAESSRLYPIEANEIFVALPDAIDTALKNAGAKYHPWPGERPGEHAYRFVTAFDTDQAEVQSLLAAARTARAA